MNTLGITRFEDLIGHMDGLAEAGREAGVEAEAVDFLEKIRQRLVRIYNHLSGLDADTEPEVEPTAKSVKDTDDFLDQFGALTDAARGAGLPSAVAHYLHTSRLRMRFSLRGQQEGRRIANRDDQPREAGLEWHGGSETVKVVDSSAYGAGVIARNPVGVHAVAHLTIQGEGGRRRHECLVVYCEPQDAHYHIGLEIFATHH
ncbi:hypothetical protein AN478_03000 [Thiohalorhabdus denitrificans]|uniref:PilZ domain-containing protein n=1 Tax=Thiohalorhabdus denitrificans TaxID=381306 RepID=A0A0P9C915_9GAMM|nr:hypothetical protein [Thiohalorhabdus denitrificans]KPV41546.1 hypothetical protein AN478_03000 [Thiohalorhabdus denitrificans]SCY31227.1 hypothetical protein SAMN05661077_1800 [Thiohalorhabdus denitrificans]